MKFLKEILFTSLATSIFAYFAYSKAVSKPEINSNWDLSAYPPILPHVSERTHIVDELGGRGGSNLLIRGNLPLLRSNIFSYEEIKRRVHELSLMNLADHRLIVVSLLHSTASYERRDLENELRALAIPDSESRDIFDKEKWPPFSQGSMRRNFQGRFENIPVLFYWHPVQGCANDQECETNEAGFRFSALVELLVELMKSKPPTVVYIHCTNGNDRVVSLAKAYLLRVGKETDSKDDLSLPREKPLDAHYKNLLDWYSRKLKKNEGFNQYTDQQS